MAEFDPAWLAAIHEAGHCAAHLEGSGVVKVWITADGRGSCQPRGRSSVISSLAGMCAEWRITRPNEFPDPADFCRNMNIADIRRAVELLGSDDGELLLTHWLAARRLVDSEWDGVVRIAQALRLYGRLSGARVEQLWRDRRMAA